MPILGSLKNVDIRTVWPNEATSFTPWLAEHINALGAAVGIDLELAQVEADVGDFSLDLLATDLGTKRRVVIENQLTPTDHDHLGKLLTYAAGFDAGAVIWVAAAIRDEHRQAIDWLNQHTTSDANFFAVAVEVLRIDDSKPAVNFKLVAFPNEWQKGKVGGEKPSPRGEAYRAFFQELIDDLREKHKFTSAKVGQPQSWYSFSSGVSGLTYGASFAQGGKFRVELYIDRGNAEENKAIFDRLFAQKAKLESQYGTPLVWERLDDRRASRIADYLPGSIASSPDDLAHFRTSMIDGLLRFKKIFGPLLKQGTGPGPVEIPA